MKQGIARITACAALAILLAGCEGTVNDDENFIVLTARVSLGPSGTEPVGPSDHARLTPDGRFIVFESRAANLVPNDTNGKRDIFRRDLATGEVIRCNVESTDFGFDDGKVDFDNVNEDCIFPSISADGRFVVFESEADDLVSNDFNGLRDVFLRDVTLGVTTRLSVDTAGFDSNGFSSHASISYDGRYIAFQSGASNLVPVDSNGFEVDVFVRDTLFQTTILVSTDSAGNAAFGGPSRNPVISGDGNVVAFESFATNLVTNDINGEGDVFIKTWLAPTPSTTRVSVEETGDLDSDGDPDNTNGTSSEPSISADGRFVAFLSLATDIVAGDNNNETDIYVRDTLFNINERASVTAQGGEPFDPCQSPVMSGDGRFVTFESNSPDLVLGDTNNAPDIFLRDLVSNTTIRISLATYGVQSATFFPSTNPSISGDGRFVVFTSFAPNLAPNDINGAPDIFLRGPLY
jgi:Tol biopolymer transport system component